MKFTSHKTSAFIIGILILLAYSMLAGSAFESRVPTMLFDVISGLAVCGIAIILYSYFKPYSSIMSREYLTIRILEGLLMIAAGILFLLFSTQGPELHNWIYEIHTYVFILGGFLFYYLLYKSVIVPKFISIWGLIAIVLLLIVNLLRISGFIYPILDILYLPIVSNEIFLAIWFMIKGFNQDVIVAEKL